MTHDHSKPDRDPQAAMVTAAARALCRQHAAMCNVNEADAWILHAEDFKADALAALNACGAVRAVNSHAELLEALQAIVAEADGPGKPTDGDSYLPPEFISRARTSINRATSEAS